MQFKNTSDAASQTDTNQHNVGGELHAKLLWPGRRRGLAGLRGDVQAHISDTAPPVWRAQEGPEGTGGLRGAVPKGLMGLAAAPVGGGGAWPGIETKHKHTSALRTPLVWRAPEGPEGLAAAPALVPGPARAPHAIQKHE